MAQQPPPCRPRQSSPDIDALTGLPKDSSRGPPTPPPAYCPPPRRRSGPFNWDNITNLPAFNPALPPEPIPLQQFRDMRRAAGIPWSDADEDDYAADDRSPIEIRISTAVHVSGDNNTVCLAATPAVHAASIAQAVTDAVKENCGAAGGIPMIDEEGRPRPITIEIDAGLAVNGLGNVVGNQSVVLKAIGEKRKRLDQEVEHEVAARRLRVRASSV